VQAHSQAGDWEREETKVLQILLSMEEKEFIFKSTGAEQTMGLGNLLGTLLEPGEVIALVGELGAGKTTLVKGIAQGLGVADKRVVKSPTFSLIHRYEGRIPIYHFDAYRLKDTREMFDIGCDEVIYGTGVTIIEWADKVLPCLPERYMQITFTIVSNNERSLKIKHLGRHYHKLLQSIKINHK